MMKLPQQLVLATTLVGFIACADEPTSSDEKTAPHLKTLSIVGGTNAGIEQLPWQVSVQLYGGHWCGGSILDASRVLTAAHCLTDIATLDLTVVAGRTRLGDVDQGQVRRVRTATPHPDYTTVEHGFDVAILQLEQPLGLNRDTVDSVRILTPQLSQVGFIAAGRVGTVSGWGALRTDGPSPDTLQRVDVPLVARTTAEQAYGPLAPGQPGTDERSARREQPGGLRSLRCHRRQFHPGPARRLG